MIINFDDAIFKALITVTYPSGTCTVTHADSGVSYSHSGGGTHTFAVHRRGEWAIEAVDGTRSKSDTAVINDRGQIVSKTLAYDFVLFDASFASGYGLNNYYIDPDIPMAEYSELEVTAKLSDTWSQGLALQVAVCADPKNINAYSPPPASDYICFNASNSYSTQTLNISDKDGDMYIGFWDPMWAGLYAGYISVSGGNITMSNQYGSWHISKIVLR